MGDEDGGDTGPEVVAFGAYVQETCGPVRRTEIELLPDVPTMTE